MLQRAVLVLLALAVAVAPAPAQQADWETTELADGVYQFRWRTHNTIFVVGGGDVVAFDPISSDAAQVLAREIERVAPGSELRAVVYSHHHADHATGAPALMAALGQRAPIIAHERTHEHLAAEPDPELPAPDVSFSDQMTLRFGGRTLELHYLGPSHSDDITVARLPDAELVFAVDFVSRDAVGYRDLASYHFPELFDAIRELRELDFETVAFGHGPPGDRAAIDRQLRYYTELRDAVADALEHGLSEDEAAERVRLPAYSDWSSYDAWFPLNVRGVYRWLEERGR